MIPVEEDSL